MNCPECLTTNPEGAKFCNECGARLQAAQPEWGERRHATVVFSDLSGYTAMSERLDPEDVEAIMARIKRTALTVVEQHGGMVNQFIGDEIVALFGVPLARPDDAQRAVRCVLELHRRVHDIAIEIEPRVGKRVTLHTGVNTGLFVARRTESRDGHFSLTGDTVNTGARLLALAGADEVVVGPETWRQVCDAFRGRARPAVMVKGKDQPIVPYLVIGELAETTPASPIVGRHAEVARIGSLLTSALHAGGALLLIRGEAGIGKSRLLAEIQTMARPLGYRCHFSRVLDFGALRDRDPVRTLARGLLGLSENLPGAAAPGAAALAAASEQGWLSREDQAFLLDLLGEAPDAEAKSLLAAIEADERQARTLDLLARLARHAAIRSPRVLMVEDIHWAEPWTLACLAGIARAVPETALLLVCTARPEFNAAAHPAFGGLPWECIELRRLPLHVTRELAAACDLPQEVRERCVERADGNPLFLQQLLLNCISSALDSVPGSIQSLVAARVDRLPAVDKAAIQAAAVLGQRFNLATLRFLLGDAGYGCAELIKHHLLASESDGAELVFIHALVCDGAYQSLLLSDRRELHRKAATWFVEREPALAAAHFERADDERAAACYLAAAHAEVSAFCFERALVLVDAGMAAPGHAPLDFAFKMLRAQILLDSERSQEAAAEYAAALDATDDPADRCLALIGMAGALRLTEQIQAALDLLEQAQPLAEAAGLRVALARLHHLRGNLLFPLGRVDDCLTQHQQALAYARQAAATAEEVAAHGGLADAYFMQGRMAAAYEQFSLCIALAQQHGLVRVAASNLPMLGITCFATLRLDEAMTHANAAIDLARRLNLRRAELIARVVAGFTQACIRGLEEEGTRELNEQLAVARAMRSPRFEGQALAFVALHFGYLDKLESARAAAFEGLALMRASDMRFMGAAALGVAALYSESAQEKAQFFAEGEALLAQGVMSFNHYVFRKCGIEAAIDAGDWAEAERHVNALAGFSGAEPAAYPAILVEYGLQLAQAGQQGRIDDDYRAFREKVAGLGMGVLLHRLDAFAARLMLVS